jgi:hypothetical protein
VRGVESLQADPARSSAGVSKRDSFSRRLTTHKLAHTQRLKTTLVRPRRVPPRPHRPVQCPLVRIRTPISLPAPPSPKPAHSLYLPSIPLSLDSPNARAGPFVDHTQRTATSATPYLISPTAACSCHTEGRAPRIERERHRAGPPVTLAATLHCSSKRQQKKAPHPSAAQVYAAQILMNESQLPVQSAEPSWHTPRHETRLS